MTFELMKENLKTIKLLEKDLMRDLTEEEKEIVINNGWEAFLFKHLGFTDNDFKELKALKAIISAFYTQSEDIFEEAIKNCPEGAYFVLRDIVDAIEDNQSCSLSAQKPTSDYESFMKDLFKSLPESEITWFNKLPEDFNEKLYNVYKEHRNDKQDCSDDALGGIITDAVKDIVLEDMISKLKDGETVEMTNDEYLETADYLAEHENKFFLNNNNGKVTLKVF